MKLAILDVTCIQASTGVSSGGADAFSGLVTVAMGALGAAVGVAAGAAATVGTAGIGIPLTVALPALAGASAATMGLVVTQGGIAAAKAIGSSMADELYIKVNGSKVFPVSDPYVELKSGQSLRHKSEGPGWDEVYIAEGTKFVREVKKGVIYGGDPGGTTATIELYEHDVISSDDLLATFPVSLTTPGTNVPYIAPNAAEGSIYMITVSVF